MTSFRTANFLSWAAWALALVASHAGSLAALGPRTVGTVASVEPMIPITYGIAAAFLGGFALVWTHIIRQLARRGRLRPVGARATAVWIGAHLYGLLLSFGVALFGQVLLASGGGDARHLFGFVAASLLLSVCCAPWLPRRLPTAPRYLPLYRIVRMSEARARQQQQMEWQSAPIAERGRAA